MQWFLIYVHRPCVCTPEMVFRITQRSEMTTDDGPLFSRRHFPHTPHSSHCGGFMLYSGTVNRPLTYLWLAGRLDIWDGSRPGVAKPKRTKYIYIATMITMIMLFAFMLRIELCFIYSILFWCSWGKNVWVIVVSFCSSCIMYLGRYLQRCASVKCGRDKLSSTRFDLWRTKN